MLLLVALDPLALLAAPLATSRRVQPAVPRAQLSCAAATSGGVGAPTGVGWAVLATSGGVGSLTALARTPQVQALFGELYNTL